MFTGKMPAKHILAVFRASGDDFDASLECLLDGPTLNSIIRMLNNQFNQQPTVKLQVDPEDAWYDVVTLYKSKKLDVTKRLRVSLHQQPVLDTGGVRRQLYSCVYNNFISNRYIRLFDGPEHYRRPVSSAEARSSGLFKVLGAMISHSVAQDGIGFLTFHRPAIGI